MNKKIKRKPDFRRIRTSKTYTLPEISKAMDRKVATVNRWVREGLPVMDDKKPILILGADLKQWLQDKWARKKRKCKLGEIYCCKCKVPRNPGVGTISIILKNEKSFIIHAKCSCCECELRQNRSMVKLQEIQRIFRSLERDMQSLFGLDIPHDKRTSESQVKDLVEVTEHTACTP